MKVPSLQLLSLLSSFATLSCALNGKPQQRPLESTPAPPSTESESELVYLHRKLISHESITGNELDVGKWLASYLRSHNLTVETQEVSSTRYNLIAYPGDSAKTDILVTSHIDTVPPFWKYERSTASNAEDTIWGRGSVDDKGSVASQIIAVLDLFSQARASNLSPPSISLLFVVGEEKGGDGMRYFSDHAPTNYSAVVFGEPTEGKLAAGHKGNLGFKLHVKGKAAHSGYPWLGISANDVMVEALARLRALEEHLPKSDKYGMTTLNIGKVYGGVAANVVAETAEAEIMTRIAASVPATVKAMVSAALEPVKKRAEEKGGSLEVEYFNTGYGPIDIETDIPGFDTLTVNYGTDIPNLEGDYKSYLYGPGNIFVAHSDHEHLTVGDLETAVGDYKRILSTLLERL
ncbi:acetylornithine deacetylase-like protein [Rhizodiscina lignyota]|uniref:Peptide hydrolase n=1 Tax=Rhizodiscina lignyota TaxID=1504668 RepID=A0A9P4IG65_9PEZI|nr:acetylornithine deacetylase-like protein [Rhizodiscina lignyota]